MKYKTIGSSVTYNRPKDVEEYLKNEKLFSRDKDNHKKGFLFETATYYGFNEIVKILLKDSRFDFLFTSPKSNMYTNIYISYIRMHRDTVKIVLDDNRFDDSKLIGENFFTNFCNNHLKPKRRKANITAKIKSLYGEF